MPPALHMVGIGRASRATMSPRTLAETRASTSVHRPRWAVFRNAVLAGVRQFSTVIVDGVVSNRRCLAASTPPRARATLRLRPAGADARRHLPVPTPSSQWWRTVEQRKRPFAGRYVDPGWCAPRQRRMRRATGMRGFVRRHSVPVSVRGRISGFLPARLRQTGAAAAPRRDGA